MKRYETFGWPAARLRQVPEAAGWSWLVPDGGLAGDALHYGYRHSYDPLQRAHGSQPPRFRSDRPRQSTARFTYERWRLPSSFTSAQFLFPR